MSTREEKENRWVAQYDKEFPPLSSKDATTREYKIDFMRKRGKARFEDFQRQQKEKEARQKDYAEQKKQRRREAYDRNEASHIEELQARLGDNWYKLIQNTKFDCEKAIDMRCKQQTQAEEDEWEEEMMEQRWQKEREEEDKKNKEYMATLSPLELKKYKRQLREELEEQWESSCWDNSCHQVRAMNMRDAKNKENDEAWAHWIKNPNDWDWQEMSKLI